MAVRFVVAGCVLLATTPAHAIVPRPTAPLAPLAADTLTALPAAGVARPLRSQAELRWSQGAPSFAWQAFVATEGGTWQAGWDLATGVPTRIWGSGIRAPGASAKAAVAEAVARRVLADHLALLAPGSALTDFELVSDVDDGDVRAIGFIQRSGGRRVVGGQISFLFKRDRLFVIGSEALPGVTVTRVQPRLAAQALHARAVTSVRAAVGLPAAPVTSPGEEVVLPLVADSAVLGYRIAAPVTIDGGAAGKYLAYVDPATGDVIAALQQNMYATGTVLYHGVDRYPGHGYVDRPAPRAYVQVDGAPQTTTTDGVISWPTAVAASVVTAISGDLATVLNKATDGLAATATMTIAPNGQIVWDASQAVIPQGDGTMDHQDDAQVQAYLDVNIAKDYVRTHIDPLMMTLDEQLVINANLPQACNAFFDGKALNFFHATNTGGNGHGCENTGRIQDVGFHEYGHRVHTAEIIMGVGAFDGAMSEGAADFLAVSITGDHGMGRGFFFNAAGFDDDQPLRDLDPDDLEYRWPQDIGEIHHTGLIFGGTFWDLRKTLIAELGEDAGVALVDRLYLGALRRSINIPSSLIEVLATDDDDGDLTNGTPHECEIRQAFGSHGIRTATGNVDSPGAIDAAVRSVGIVAHVTGLSPRCAGDELASAQVGWHPGGNGEPTAGYTNATLETPDQLFAQLPVSPQDSMTFSLLVLYQDGSQLVLPDNRADPLYQIYQGRTVKLYCTDFETDPFAAGWTTGTDDATASPWAWGTPGGGGATDPQAAFSGTHVLALGLNADYPPAQRSWVATPEIDIGQYSDVRVQYRRWLAVEDSHFDQARVLADDVKVWQNATSNLGDSSALDHVDREWRFQDVPVSGYFHGRKLTVKWELKADAGVQLGGWTLDDVCIVANPYAICGDGIKSTTEACDDGPTNADSPDACRTDCTRPTCGDRIVDSTEECDDGPEGSPTCTAKCTLISTGPAGCCSASGGPGAGVLGFAIGALVLRRRRRARRAIPCG